MLASRVVSITYPYALCSLRQPSINLNFSYIWQLFLRGTTYFSLDSELLLLSLKAGVYSSVSTYKYPPSFVTERLVFEPRI